MQNIIFNSVQYFKQTYGVILSISYQQATNTIVLINNEFCVITLQYVPKQNSLRLKQKTSPIDELSLSKILVADFLVDQQKVLCVTENGSIFTLDSQANVQIKAQNQDGICGASVSPTQQYLYLVTKNKTIVQLDMEFDMVNEVPLDQNDDALSQDPKFTWRPDGNYFALNINTKSGRKCVTRDKMMNIHISPAKSDPNPKDPVQSIAEKGRINMGSSVAWQPNGGIIAGTDHVDLKQRVIFWQKNGLRHLQFQLLSTVSRVNDLFWSVDSTTLFVDAQVQQKRVLLIYYRANYKWHLKNQIYLSANQKVVTFKIKNNKILLVSQKQLRIVDYSIDLSRSQWNSKQQQKANPYSLVYCIDGNLLKLNDYSKALIPPPFSMHTIDAQQVIIGHAISSNLILLITPQKYLLYKYQQNKIIKSFQNSQKQVFYGVYLLSKQSQPLKFIVNQHFYEEKQGKIIKAQKCTKDDVNQRLYSIVLQNGDHVDILCQKTDNNLIVNDRCLTQDCLSYLFYHEFLMYTVSTNDMYDRMIIFNLKLDTWLWDDTNPNITDRIEELQQKQKLNLRNVQRGSKIITCCQGRVVFQLPRGNLQGIFPKIVMINEVKNKMDQKQYGKAFELVRTHRLDLNLLIDLDPKRFMQQTSELLCSISRVDYLNLLISQISQKVSTQISYALSTSSLQVNSNYHTAHLKGTKIKKICEIISKQLRLINKDKYILSIFTSDIRRGLLNEVLFQIKEMRQYDVEILQLPHVTKNKPQNKGKKINSQEILEYVCWLVDANFIYQAALLTYDLQLTAMTARCTQKDPKQYIPYIQMLKTIQDQVQFKKKICLDLKKYSIAIKQLSFGSEQQKKQAIQLIRTHKLFKCGLQTFAKQSQKLKLVKNIIINELLSNGQTSEAYQIAKSIQDYEKCLQIATNNSDTKKIKQCLQSMTELSREQKIKRAQIVIESIKQESKSKSDLARLLVYVGNYQQAVALYLKAGDYRKFYQYINKVSQQFINSEVIPGLQLQCSLKKNLLLKDKLQYHQKHARLLQVQKYKKSQGGQVHTFKNKQNQDMYSEVSMSSKASSYTISTTTGMRKKKDKKRHILSRNVKEGSLLEEEYLLAFLDDLKARAEDNIRDAKLLVQHLIYMNLITEAEEVKQVVMEYIQVMSQPKMKFYAKIKFEELHPQAAELYYEEKKNNYTFDSFNYLLEDIKK